MSGATINDVMTTGVATVREDTAYRAIIDTLAARRIGAAPVVDGEGRVVGVVSEADLLHKIELAGQGEQRRIFLGRHRAERAKAEGQVARDFMSAPAVTCHPGTTVAGAARLMAAKGVKRLPVVDDEGRLVGVVSRADLLKGHLRADDDLRQEIIEQVLGRTLWLAPDAVTALVDDGVVTLRGRVDRRSVAEMAVRITGTVPGVVEVRDDLTYEMDDSEMIASGRWYRSHPFSAS